MTFGELRPKPSKALKQSDLLPDCFIVDADLEDKEKTRTFARWLETLNPPPSMLYWKTGCLLREIEKLWNPLGISEYDLVHA